MKSRKYPSRTRRDGAVMIMFVILLPVLILFAAIAINLAKVELTRTELQIATDVSTRAAGTAWSATGELEDAMAYARIGASLNDVQGAALQLQDQDIVFGVSERTNETGRYDFVAVDTEEANLITAIRVTGEVDTGLFFEISGINSIRQQENAVTSQVDRDIALVIDRSGSMAYFEDEQFLFDTITALHEDASNGISVADYRNAVADFQGVGSLAAMSLNSRAYSDSVLVHLTGDLRTYALTVNSDYRSQTRAPRESRWAVLEQALDSFFEVLETSPIYERISVSSFASDATLDLRMTDDLELAKNTVLGLYPTESTAIGTGMESAIDELLASKRLNAVPTMVVLSDGENKKGKPPVQVALDIKRDHPHVVINTVTFADGDQTEMAEVALIGGGRHFHANDGDELMAVFDEIARSFSTVITE